MVVGKSEEVGVKEHFNGSNGGVENNGGVVSFEEEEGEGVGGGVESGGSGLF